MCVGICTCWKTWTYFFHPTLRLVLAIQAYARASLCCGWKTSTVHTLLYISRMVNIYVWSGQRLFLHHMWHFSSYSFPYKQAQTMSSLPLVVSRLHARGLCGKKVSSFHHSHKWRTPLSLVFKFETHTLSKKIPTVRTTSEYTSFLFF